MIDLGKKHAGMGSPENPERMKSHISYPSMSGELKQMPFLKGADIDDEMIITFKCKVKSINKYNDGDTVYGLDLIAAEKSKGEKDE